MGNVLITGVSSGIGYALAKAHIERGDRVYGIGINGAKTLISDPNFSFFPLDLSDADFIRFSLRDYLPGRTFDRVILNAGIYPKMQQLSDIPMKKLRDIMNINLWSHKNIIDSVLSLARAKQIVAFGAAPTNFNKKGMGAYAISKSALITMMQIYALESPHVHFSTIAPGLILSETFESFLHDSDSELYPEIQALRERPIATIEQVTPKLMEALDKVTRLNSGAFTTLEKLSEF